LNLFLILITFPVVMLFPTEVQVHAVTSVCSWM
jgi:hypothetical protein